jgi:hypothetical protein
MIMEGNGFSDGKFLCLLIRSSAFNMGGGAMKKPGFAIKIAAVVNAILLVVGFMGCQSGAFNWISDTGEPVKSAAKLPEVVPTGPSSQGSVAVSTAADVQASQHEHKMDGPASSAASKSVPTFIPSTKAVILPNIAQAESLAPSKSSQNPP